MTTFTTLAKCHREIANVGKTAAVCILSCGADKGELHIRYMYPRVENTIFDVGILTCGADMVEKCIVILSPQQ